MNEALKDVTKAWKSRMQVVPRFTTNGGKDAMRVVEQYVIDVLRLDGNEIRNPIEAVNKKRGRLRNQYGQFMKNVCK